MANVDEDDQLTKNLQAMTVSDTDVNILLLGETGVGKSTFINAFANYLEYDEFDRAEKDDVRCLIPTKFTVTNQNFEEKIVEIGKDNNENNTMTESATLEARSYVFPIQKRGIHRIRLIDTPGIGDTRGIEQDNENMENILSYISHIENLHAICFLLKPNNTRLTVMFHYCIKQLLSRLDKSASKNIIFLFTNTRSSFYQPGDTTTALKTILKDIKEKPPFAHIKFQKDNVFCLDNESFRYLVAIKSNIELGNKESFVDSWNHSVKECWRMLDYVTGKGSSKITPHKVKDTVSVNEARRVILQLSQPLADIAELINDNIKTLNRHNQTIQRDNLSIADLKKNLFVPVINLRTKELSQPTTVCTAKDCIEIYMVNKIKKYHYKQRCHDPCYLQNVPREHIGSPELVKCWAMMNNKCKICKCDFSTHMHIYYVSETYQDQIDNEGVKAQIKDREAALKETKKLVATIESRKTDYENEKNTIIRTMAEFAHFLQRNAIAPYNDAYKAYIDYLIDREKSQGDNCDFELVKYYNDLLKRYFEEKQILEAALSPHNQSATNVTAKGVFDSVQALYKLPHTGKQIQQLHSQMIRNQSSEHKNTEFVLAATRQYATQKETINRNKKNFKQKQKQVVKERTNLNNQPNMKAKNRRSDVNNKGHNVNPQHSTNSAWQQSPPDLRYINMSNYVPPQNQYNYSPRPQNSNFFDPRFQFPQQQAFHGNFSNFQHVPPQNNFGYWEPSMHRQFAQHPANFQNFAPQRGNSSNQAGSISSSPNNPFNSEPKNNVNIEANTHDPNFDEWYRNILGGTSTKNDDTSAHFLRHNNFSKGESSDDESNSDQSDDQRATDDDDDFKEFMRKNNLEYLVKSPSSSNSVRTNENTNKNKKNRNFRKSGKVNQKDSDSDEPEKSTQSKIKSSLGFFLNKLL
ncbi:hypothetical protein Trydic_g11331 [Trypoxylus dichotomus]